MAISFAKNCKDRCPVFSPCFGVIPEHTWSKNGTRPVITPNLLKFLRGKSGTLENLVGCISVTYLPVVHPVKHLPMSVANVSQMSLYEYFT